jgi:hypothetical protein
MPSISAKRAALAVHPSTPNEAVRTLSAWVRKQDSDMLVFDYLLDADLSRLRIPQPSANAPVGAGVGTPSGVQVGAGQRAHALWEHTCFEAFVVPVDVPGYHEFNFSPSGDWAIYRFDGYREGMAEAKVSRAPQILLHRGDGRVALEATVHLESLAVLRDAARLKVGLAAVIEGANGRLCYWALRHPPGTPDFHHPSAFALEVLPA